MRRKADRETWHRLLEWDSGKAASERMSARLLQLLNYKDIDPSHPLGGRDGKKDIVCADEKHHYVVGCYFPRGQKTFNEIKGKFTDDLNGAIENDKSGFIFITNQELRLREREELEEQADLKVDIFHLEKLSNLLSMPIAYGIRLEFLDIEMEKEEQLAFINAKEQQMKEISKNIELLLDRTDPKLVSDPVYVSPRVVDSYLSIIAERHHKCDQCGFGYLVKNDRHLSMLSFGAIGDRVVVCPKCKNTEKYNGHLLGF